MSVLRLAVLIVFLTCRVSLAAMSYGSSDSAGPGTPEVTAAPLTFCAWVMSSDAAAIQSIASIYASGSNNYFGFGLRGDIAGDPARVVLRTPATVDSANTTTGYSVSTWHAICGTFSSTTLRTAYIDGGSSASNTTSIAPGSIDSLIIARLQSATHPFIGRIAELGIWNRVLSAAELTAFARGFAPSCMRTGLLGYYPQVRDTSSIKDLFGTRRDLTISGSPSRSGHPPITNCQ